MAMKKCDICGTKIKVGTSRCSGCGMPLVNLNNITKNKFNTPSNKTIDDRPLTERTLYYIKKINFLSKLTITATLFSLILLFIHAIIKLNILLIILCIILFLCLPYVGLPATWMQLMLEHIFEINNKTK